MQANAYNGLDDRVRATSGSTAHRFVFDADGRVLGEYGASATAVIGETIWLSPQIAANDNQFGGGDGVGGYAPLGYCQTNQNLVRLRSDRCDLGRSRCLSVERYKVKE